MTPKPELAMQTPKPSLAKVHLFRHHGVLDNRRRSNGPSLAHVRSRPGRAKIPAADTCPIVFVWRRASGFEESCMSRIIPLGWAAALVAGALAGFPQAQGQEPQPPANGEFENIAAAARNPGAGHGQHSNFRDFAEVTHNAEKIDGLFTLYKTGDHLYIEIRPDQCNQPLLTPVTIARGLAQAGMPVGDDDRVLIFRRVGDRVQVVRRNIHYKAPAGTPIEKAVKQNFTDSVLMALPIVTLNPMRGGAVLIDLSDVFMTDFAEIGMGSIDRSRSQWSKVKGFPNNMELELEATYTGGYRRMGSGRSGGGSDPRGITLVLHYSIMRAPDMGYRPRIADDRVGHF